MSKKYDELIKQAYRTTGGLGASFYHDEQGNPHVESRTADGRTEYKRLDVERDPSVDAWNYYVRQRQAQARREEVAGQINSYFSVHGPGTNGGSPFARFTPGAQAAARNPAGASGMIDYQELDKRAKIAQAEKRRQQQDKAKRDYEAAVAAYNQAIDRTTAATNEPMDEVWQGRMERAQAEEDAAKERVDAAKKALDAVSDKTYSKVVDRLLGVDSSKITGEKTSWWDVVKGSAVKGANQWNAANWKTIKFLFGDAAEELHTLGTETVNQIIGGLNKIPGVDIDYLGKSRNLIDVAYDDAQAGLKAAQEKYDANANSSRAAQIVDNLGTGFVAALPMAVEAFLLGPAQAAQAGAAAASPAGLSYFAGLQSASGIQATGMMARQGMEKLFQNPQFWSSYLQVAGDGYEDALADGMSNTDASIYGLINGFFNATIEIGGADETLGGIQNLPMRMAQLEQQGGKKAVVEWFKDSVLGEGLEEVQQGIFERGMKSFSGQNVPVASLDPTDTRAIFNPWTSAQEFTGGAVVGGLLGGGQIATQNLVKQVFAERGINLTDKQQKAIMETRDDGSAGASDFAVGTREAYEMGENGATMEETVEQVGEKYGLTPKQARTAWGFGASELDSEVNTDKAYEMGKSGVSKSYLNGTEEETTAYERGQAEAFSTAAARAEKIQGRKNEGNLARVKGVVKGEGVNMEDLRKTFNDRQNTAYRLLTKYAETTGVNIVLYKSEADENGQFPDAQGRFQWKDDTIYIDINSGLNGVKDVDNLGKYTMMRVFAHEFTHFIEKWNPVEYNNFREYVFKALEESGQNVNDLIEAKQAMDASGKMSYEQASREAVADGMMDVLSDSTLVQQLAQENQTVFRKLLDKLRDFAARLKQHYREFSGDASAEAKALKANSDYLNGIVKMWDEIAKGAVENYQGAKGEAVLDQPGKPSNLPKRRTPEKSSAVRANNATTETRPVGRDRFPANDLTSEAEADQDVRRQPGVRRVQPVGRERFGGNDLTSREETGERLLDRVPKKAESAAEDNNVPGKEDTPEMASLRAEFKTHDVVEKNDIEYRIRYIPGAAVYEARIRNVSDERGPYPVRNARGLLYISTYATRDEALDDIVAIANNNGLLKPQEQRRNGSADAFANGDIFSEDRIRDAAGNNAATEIIQKMPEAPKTRTSTKTSRAVKDWKNGTPSQKAAYAIIQEHLEKGKDLPSKALYKICDDAFGGTQAEGTYDRKDAYDAMELAVNRYMLDVMQEYNDGTVENAQRGLAEAQRILSLLPTQNVRTQEQQDFQQFSTPPSIAYLTAWAAKISKGDSVLEPSAGIGGIATFAKAWGADVTVNELSKRRLGLLQAMGFDRTFNENAEQIDNVLPDEVQPSVVVMNPPFSSTAGRTKNNKTSNAERHINQALERLNEGGRLVAVVGRGMADANYSKYWNKVRERYTIRANIGIDGENYKKYGTTFDVQIVVIDKTGPQGDQKTLTGYYKDLAEIPQALEGIRNDRNAETERKPGITGNQKPAAPAEAKPEPVRSAVDQASPETGGERESDRRDHDGRGSRESGSADVQRTGGNKEAVRNARPDERGAVGEQRASEPDSQNQQAEQREPDAGRTGTSADVQGESGQQRSGLSAEPARRGQVEQQEPSDDGVYATYKAPKLTTSGSRAHPATLVESAAMAAVDMPEATYTPKLPPEVVKNNLSEAQMVSVTYAGQAHEQKLPGGERRGFFIGDGTGVGKGRQISGIILDNFMQGRKKAVWISEKQSLYNDAVRDWTETTGRSKDEVHDLSKVKLQNAPDFKDGILYTTYDTLRTEKNGKSRVQQIADWFGKDFDGVIAFDEAHNMGNLLGKRGKFGKAKGSAKAMAAVELQRLLPNARVVYVSATAATEVDGLAFASRLGLWGKGTAFTDVNDFVSKIGSSGLAAMELVIRDMKAMGMYVARSISYNGVEYGTIQHDLDPVQRQIYDTMSRAWQTTMRSVEESLESTGAKYNSAARRNAIGQYYGAMQRFYNQVLTSMSMPSVIADMRKQLAAGKSCVLQIVNTNQAEADRQIASIKAEGGELDEMDLTPRGTLIDYLMKCYPVTQFEEYTDDDGNTQSRPVTNSKGEPVIDKAAERKRDALIAEINQMSIPDGPLEMLFNAFGTDEVSEITGRTRRVVPKRQADGSIARVEEKRTPKHKEADVNAFQNGDKRILVFNNAGGTGKSYHADLRAKNQQQRVHYVLQPGWEASRAVQGFGRTHRSNEASAPIYKLVTTNIKGQKRFTSTIARRLDQLGALTKGQRDTGSGMFGASDNLETDLARDSLREFYSRLGKNKLEGIEGREVLRKLGLLEKFTDEHGVFKVNDTLARDISTFLNRILVLEVDEQNRVFDAFISIYEAEMDAAIAAGTLDRGMENVKADKIEIVDDSIIKEQKGSTATTHYVQAKVYTKPKIITTVAEAENYRTGFVGLYRTKDGDVRAVYRIADKTTEWGAIQKQYKLQSPNRSKSSVWQESSLEKNAEAIPKGEWQAEWDKEIAKVPEYNEETKHMLTGALLPIWDALPQEGNTKVQRLIADDGSTYLGRVIAPDQIDAVLSRFNVNRTKETFTAQQVFDKAIKSGTQFNLSYHRASIFRSKVSGEWRLEYSQPTNPWSIKTMYPDMVMEKINWQNRFFIPLNDKGRAMLEKILEANPVANTSEERGEEFSTRRQTVSDREVLQMAASEIEVEGLSDGEKDALRIFNETLDKLQEAQEKREELGRQYKEQQFTKGGSRTEAAQTLNRMNLMDTKIKALENRVLSLENKDVLKRVLQKARAVVESQEKARGKQVLQQYREKLKENAATRKYRDRVRAQVLEFSKFMTSPSNKDVLKHVPAEIQKSMVDFLDCINLSSKTALNSSGAKTTKADEQYLKAMKNLRKAIKQNVDSRGLYSGYADLPEGFMDDFDAMIQTAEEIIEQHKGEFVINQMSAAELKELSNVLKVLKKHIQEMNRFHNNAMFQHLDEAGENTIDTLSPFERSKRNGFIYKFARFDYMRPSVVFEHFGEGGKSIGHEFQEGQAVQAFLANKIIDFAKKTFKGKEVKAWSKDIKTFTLSGGEEISLPATAIMTIYCLNKRPQAQTHLYGDGIRVANYKADGKVQLDEGHLLTVDDIQKMVQTLTPRQIEVADALQKFMSKDCAEWGNYVSMRRFGVEQFGEANYFPINSDGRYLPATADESPTNAALYALLNMGFTKELKEKAKNRIIIYNIFDVFANHTASMAQYRAFALPVLDALRWFNYKNDATSVRDKLSMAFGAPEETRAGSGSKGYAESFVINLLRAYNGTAPQGDPYDSIDLKMLHRFNGAQIAYNLRVVIQQPTAIVRAATILSPAKLTKGLGMSIAQMRKLADEMEQHSGIAAWKRLGFYDTNISRGLTELIKQTPTVLDRVMDVGTWGAEQADRFTWAAMWYAAKDSVNRSRYDSEEAYFKAVTELFEDVIYKTQVVDSILTKSEFLRAKGGVARQLGSFMSEPSATMSMLSDAYFKYTDDMQRGMSRSAAWQKNSKNIMRAFGVYAVGQITLAAMQAVVDAWRDDDEYDAQNWLSNFLQKWLNAFKGNAIEEFLPFGKVPVVSEIYETVKGILDYAGIFEKLGLDLYGNDISSGLSMYLKYVDKTAKIIIDYTGDTGYTKYGIIYNLMRGASNVSGIPAATITREAVDLWNNTVGFFAPSKKLVTYQRKRDKDYETIRDTGISKKAYEKALDDSDEDHNGSIKQDELGEYLTEAISRGEITEEQADAVWKTKWNSANSKTFDKWRSGKK